MTRSGLRTTFLAALAFAFGCGTSPSIPVDGAVGAPDGGMASDADVAAPPRDADGSSQGSTDLSEPPLIKPPPLANLPGWVNALAVGEWTQIPNTALSSVEPSPIPEGNTGPRSKVDAWTSFVVDSNTSVVYSVANGGHKDYSGNEVDALELEHDPPRWVERLAPTPAAQVQEADHYLDGRPAARHTYYGVTFDEAAGRIMLFSGARWSSSGAASNSVDSYSVAGNSWSPAGTHPDVPSHLNSYPLAAFAYVPGPGDVYAFGNYDVLKWQKSSNTWVTITPVGAAVWGYGAASAYDTLRDRILLLGGQVNEHAQYSVGNQHFDAVTVTPKDPGSAADVSGAAAVLAANQAQLLYVPAIDKFLWRGADAGGGVLQVDPVTFAVTPFVTAGGGAVPSVPNGPFRKFLYVPRLHGCVYVPAYQSSAWFVRVH